MTMRIPRYLADFHPKRCPHYFADVLIVGGGLAGLRAANAVDPRCSVLVVTKDRLKQSNSTYAQGGIAGVLDPSDRFDNHVRDTLDAGGRLCDENIVGMVVREAPRRIEELIRWGAEFDQADGELSLGREGGHSHHRIVHALGDATGREVMRAVIQWTRDQQHITIWENSFTIDLLTYDGECRGGLVARPGEIPIMVWAKQTILCTGGAGQLYRESTNPPIATGDGHALAYRAGAELRDMEFMQFHPTVLYIAGSSRTLITEAVRGEGAYLIDRDGRRFMFDYDERAELAPRDIVSNAIVRHMEQTRHPCVYLTMAHLPSDKVRQRFPGIAAACAKFDLDIASDRIPVRPGAHYMIGGVTVDELGRSTLPRLWAAGEVTSSGLHGANRLASNSLLEGLVYGAHAGLGAGEAALSEDDNYRAEPLSSEGQDGPSDSEPLDLADIRNSLKSLMWRSAGVRRDGREMSEAADAVAHWGRYVLSRRFPHVEGWELQNLLVLAALVLDGAQARRESRGVHWRTDFPDRDPEMDQKRIEFRRGGDAADQPASNPA